MSKKCYYITKTVKKTLIFIPLCAFYRNDLYTFEYLFYLSLTLEYEIGMFLLFRHITILERTKFE